METCPICGRSVPRREINNHAWNCGNSAAATPSASASSLTAAEQELLSLFSHDLLHWKSVEDAEAALRLKHIADTEFAVVERRATAAEPETPPAYLLFAQALSFCGAGSATALPAGAADCKITLQVEGHKRVMAPAEAGGPLCAAVALSDFCAESRVTFQLDSSRGKAEEAAAQVASILLKDCLSAQHSQAAEGPGFAAGGSRSASTLPQRLLGERGHIAQRDGPLFYHLQGDGGGSSHAAPAATATSGRIMEAILSKQKALGTHMGTEGKGVLAATPMLGALAESSSKALQQWPATPFSSLRLAPASSYLGMQTFEVVFCGSSSAEAPFAASLSASMPLRGGGVSQPPADTAPAKEKSSFLNFFRRAPDAHSKPATSASSSLSPEDAELAKLEELKKQEEEEMRKKLVAAGLLADTPSSAESGSEPAGKAAVSKHPRLLLQCILLPVSDVKGLRGQRASLTPLHRAAADGNTALLKCLLALAGPAALSLRSAPARPLGVCSLPLHLDSGSAYSGGGASLAPFHRHVLSGAGSGSERGRTELSDRAGMGTAGAGSPGLSRNASLSAAAPPAARSGGTGRGSLMSSEGIPGLLLGHLSPLDIACLQGHSSTVRAMLVLLRRLPSRASLGLGLHPLHYAVLGGNVACLALLLRFCRAGGSKLPQRGFSSRYSADEDTMGHMSRRQYLGHRGYGSSSDEEGSDGDDGLGGEGDWSWDAWNNSREPSRGSRATAGSERSRLAQTRSLLQAWGTEWRNYMASGAAAGAAAGAVTSAGRGGAAAPALSSSRALEACGFLLPSRGACLTGSGRGIGAGSPRALYQVRGMEEQLWQLVKGTSSAASASPFSSPSSAYPSAHMLGYSAAVTAAGALSSSRGSHASDIGARADATPPMIGSGRGSGSPSSRYSDAAFALRSSAASGEVGEELPIDVWDMLAGGSGRRSNAETGSAREGSGWGAAAAAGSASAGSSRSYPGLRLGSTSRSLGDTGTPSSPALSDGAGATAGAPTAAAGGYRPDVYRVTSALEELKQALKEPAVVLQRLKKECDAEALMEDGAVTAAAAAAATIPTAQSLALAPAPAEGPTFPALAGFSSALTRLQQLQHFLDPYKLAENPSFIPYGLFKALQASAANAAAGSGASAGVSTAAQTWEALLGASTSSIWTAATSTSTARGDGNASSSPNPSLQAVASAASTRLSPETFNQAVAVTCSLKSGRVESATGGSNSSNSRGSGSHAINGAADPTDILGRTPLAWAAALGQVLSVEALLSAGAAVGAADMLQETPLMHALLAGRLQIAFRLLCGLFPRAAAAGGSLPSAIVGGPSSAHGSSSSSSGGGSGSSGGWLGGLLSPSKSSSSKHVSATSPALDAAQAAGPVAAATGTTALPGAPATPRRAASGAATAASSLAEEAEASPAVQRQVRQQMEQLLGSLRSVSVAAEGGAAASVRVTITGRQLQFTASPSSVASAGRGAPAAGAGVAAANGASAGKQGSTPAVWKDVSVSLTSQQLHKSIAAAAPSAVSLRGDTALQLAVDAAASLEQQLEAALLSLRWKQVQAAGTLSAHSAEHSQGPSVTVEQVEKLARATAVALDIVSLLLESGISTVFSGAAVMSAGLQVPAAVAVPPVSSSSDSSNSRNSSNAPFLRASSSVVWRQRQSLHTAVQAAAAAGQLETLKALTLVPAKESGALEALAALALALQQQQQQRQQAVQQTFSNSHAAKPGLQLLSAAMAALPREQMAAACRYLLSIAWLTPAEHAHLLSQATGAPLPAAPPAAPASAAAAAAEVLGDDGRGGKFSRYNSVLSVRGALQAALLQWGGVGGLLAGERAGAGDTCLSTQCLQAVAAQQASAAPGAAAVSHLSAGQHSALALLSALDILEDTLQPAGRTAAAGETEVDRAAAAAVGSAAATLQASASLLLARPLVYGNAISSDSKAEEDEEEEEGEGSKVDPELAAAAEARQYERTIRAFATEDALGFQKW